MKLPVFAFAFLISFCAVAQAGTPAAIFELEKKIAYQQGQFGALYARCGNESEKGMIGGSLATWREETFRGLRATDEEQAVIKKSFDDAARDIALDSNSCNNWIKAAASTWSGIVQLSQQGVPVAVSN